MSKLAARFLLAALPAAVLYAETFWETADPADWTRPQVEELLYNSPWAKAASVDAGGSGGGGFGFPGGGSTGGGVGFPGGGGRSGGGIGFPNGGWGVPLRSSYNGYDDGDAAITVRWDSALPVRQAIAYSRDDLAPQVRDELLHRGPNHYVIAVDALPPAGAWLAEEPERLRQSSRLIRKGKPAIRASSMEIVPHPGAPGVILYFPRDEEISLDDKTVQFELTPGEVNVRAKFKLKEMVFRGELQL